MTQPETPIQTSRKRLTSLRAELLKQREVAVTTIANIDETLKRMDEALAKLPEKD